MEASVDPQCRGPDWMPITPKTGSLFHVETQFLPVSTVKLLQIARDALLDLRHAPLHLGACEVPVAVVHSLELAAVDRHAGLREKAHRAAKRNKLGADLPDSAAVVLAEVGNRLVVGSK